MSGSFAAEGSAATTLHKPRNIQHQVGSVDSQVSIHGCVRRVATNVPQTTLRTYLNPREAVEKAFKTEALKQADILRIACLDETSIKAGKPSRQSSYLSTSVCYCSLYHSTQCLDTCVSRSSTNVRVSSWMSTKF